MAAPQTGLTSCQIGDILGQSVAINLDIYQEMGREEGRGRGRGREGGGRGRGGGREGGRGEREGGRVGLCLLMGLERLPPWDVRHSLSIYSQLRDVC